MASRRATTADYLRLARPHQYIKNGFILLPLFFGQKLFDPVALTSTLTAFVAFCLVASGVYVLNDLRDVREDQAHPRKQHRPVASGVIAPPSARLFMTGLMTAGLVTAALAGGMPVLLIVAGYLVLNLLYSLRLKQLPIIDITVIAVGFILRVVAGAFASGVHPSHWIVLMTFLLALFLALAKRRDDLLLLGQGKRTRPAIEGYSFEFISSGMVLMAAVLLVSYIMYSVSPEVMAMYGRYVYLTTFWVVLGILRYLQLTFVHGQGGSPSRLLLSDRFLQVVVSLWLMNFFLLIYGPDAWS